MFGSLWAVKFIRNALLVALAIFWPVATIHCPLESLPGMDFLVCCAHDEAAPHQDSDCETDGCSLIESGLYKTQKGKISLLSSPAGTVALLPLGAEERLPSGAAHFVRGSSPPPELAKSWQFFRRTALLPRAPSFAS